MNQKEAVISEVKKALPNFVENQDVAISLLSNDQLETIKRNVRDLILAGTVTYSKPLVAHEVNAYARSMVMNHLKKAKELTGGTKVASTPKVKKPRKLAKFEIVKDGLPDYLKTYVEEKLDV